MVPGKILVVEDDLNISRIMTLYLKKNGYDPVTVANGSDALVRFENDTFDLVLLDLMLPGTDGWQICRKIREHSSVPIIITTARGEIKDRVSGLSIGADDYLVKPFDPQEMIARVQAVLRRAAQNSSSASAENDSMFRFGDLHLDASAYKVTLEDNVLELPRREFELLHCLMRHPNQVFERNDLIEKVWGWDYDGDDRVVDVNITRLRHRLSSEHPQPWAITTVRGIGYKFEVNGK